MPDMDGIELARHLLKLAHPPVVIFTTAFHEHAVQAFEVNAVDYLVKPVRVQRLLSALQKVPRLKPFSADKLSHLPASARRFLSVTERSRVVLVPIEDVVYLKAELKYITIRTREREFLLEESLTRLENEFGSRFIRVHRNCIVARHILPEQTHVLSVCFQVGEMRREWGGCAGNIAYNLRGIGGEPIVMATLGSDGDTYRKRLGELGIAIDGVREIDGTFTAQAFIITDLDDNQITAFHPGAMNHAHVNRVGDVGDIALGIVAPDGKDGMLSHAKQFADAGTPFIFDPGQGLPLFSGAELVDMIERASYLTVN